LLYNNNQSQKQEKIVALIVQKFGGTSVGDIERIKNVARIAIKTQEEGNDVVVVASAMSGNTDFLINLAKQISPQPDTREMDMMVSTGEQVSIALLAMAIQSYGKKAISYNAMQVGIKTTSDYSKAKITAIDAEKIRHSLKEGKIVTVAGFQGIDEDLNITTLGRGGSDTTAVAIAAALKADRCDIYTDVDGVYTADPRIAKGAFRLEEITHDEMLELASMGAKVLHDRSVIFAMNYNVPLRVLSSMKDGGGTLIVKEKKNMEDIVITGIAKKDNETRVNISGIPDKPGVAAEIFKKLADENINVNLIVQNVGQNNISQISFTVLTSDIEKSKKIMENLRQEFEAREVTYDENVAIVSVVGVGMRAHSGVAAAVFDELAKNQINIEMISTSEIKISVVIQKELADKTVQALHKRFFGK
jgi:aspartate kinase